MVADGWTSIDGSWQARLAGYPLAARVVATATGRDVGHWPRGIVCRDIRTGLGQRDDSAAVVYSSHVLEHLSQAEADVFLRDCYRVLCPGGVCRIVTPDLNALIGRYQRAQQDQARVAADAFLKATLLAETQGTTASPWLRWYRARTRFETHKWLYDSASLTAALQRAGFGSPRTCAYLESRIPADRLRQVERRERIDNGEGVVVEAVK